MTSRERVLQALDYQPTDRMPRDLGGMASTGISCFAYPGLVSALGLPPRAVRVHDTGQMLALPDLDVLDALACDVVTIHWGVTNAFEEPEKWRPYDFGGRLEARVRCPEDFVSLPDGTIERPKSKSRMVPGAHVFDAEHAGQSLDFLNGDDLPLKDLDRLREDLRQELPDAGEVRRWGDLCRRVRESTDRAVFYNGPGVADISISGHGGMGVFPLICTLHPAYAAEYHDIITANAVEKLETMLPEVAPFIDVMLVGCDDWGTQKTTIASPRVFRNLFLPCYRRVNDAAHRLAPNVKTFIHTCGAVYDILDDIIECGFDILNPVQWTAGRHSYREWKEKCHGRIALWGGGVNAQDTLPLGTTADVEREVAEVVSCLSEGGGYVFNSIHNILAEVPPEKVVALYRAADVRSLELVK